MNVEEILIAVAMSYLSKATSFKIDGFTVAAKLNGAPHHMTVGEGLIAASKVMAGVTGEFVIGDLDVTISK